MSIICKLAQALSALNHHPSSNSDNSINVAGLFPVSAISINSTSSNPWILDTGAMDTTNHIVSEASIMNEPNVATISTINLPNGGTTHVSQYWQCFL